MPPAVIPAALRRNVAETWGADGERWLVDLPALLAAVARDWDLDIGVLLCGHHHRLIHHDQWQARINPTDGLPEFIPPQYVDPERRPQRNPYHRRE